MRSFCEMLSCPDRIEDLNHVIEGIDVDKNVIRVARIIQVALDFRDSQEQIALVCVDRGCERDGDKTILGRP